MTSIFCLKGRIIQRQIRTNQLGEDGNRMCGPPDRQRLAPRLIWKPLAKSRRYPSFRIAVAEPAMSGGAGDGRRGWSPFDAIRSFPSTPESLMSQIDAAIASTEYARACALLDPASASSRSQQSPDKGEERGQEGEASAARAPAACYDARVADEAYRAACAALGAGRADAAVRSLRVALASCPPEKAAAVAKVRSMLAIASAQLHRQQHQAQQQQSRR